MSQRLLTLISCFLAYSIVSINLVWSSMSNYILSFYWNSHGSRISIYTLNISVPIGALVSIPCLAFSMKIGKKIGFRYLFALGGLMITITFIATPFIPNPYVFVAIYASCMSGVNAFIYIVPIYCASKLYYKNKGLITGLMLAGLGVSESAFSFGYSYLINPSNAKAQKFDGNQIFPESVTKNLHFAHFIIGGVLFLITISCFFLFQAKGLEGNYEIEDKINDTFRVDESSCDEISSQEIPLTESKEEILILSDNVYTTPNFFLLFGMVFLSSTFPYGLSANFKNTGLEFIKDDFFVSFVGGMSMFVAAISKTVFGKLIDRIKFEFIYGGILIIELLFSLCFRFFVENKYLFIVLLAGTFMSLSAHFTIFPIYTMKVFGVEQGTRAYQFVLWAYLISEVNQYVIYQFALEYTGLFNLQFIFSCYVAGGAVLMIINHVLIKRKQYEQKLHSFEANLLSKGGD